MTNSQDPERQLQNVETKDTTMSLDPSEFKYEILTLKNDCMLTIRQCAVDHSALSLLRRPILHRWVHQCIRRFPDLLFDTLPTNIFQLPNQLAWIIHCVHVVRILASSRHPQ